MTESRVAGGRSLHVDAFAGMAGNMFMGALLGIGLSRKALEEGLSALPLEFKLKVTRVQRGALAARHVEVVIPGQKRKRRSAKTPAHSHAHSHEHHMSGPGDGHGRTYAEVVSLLMGAKLSAPVRDRALAIFENLARAEAKVHGRKLEGVHFHEVGMVDAIVDVTAAALGLELLGIDRVTCGPVGTGHGLVETAHGRLPIPAPATLELLAGIPTAPLDIAFETITPTGAAILRTVVDEFGPLPAMTIDKVGYGAGRDLDGPVPNVVRLALGQRTAAWSSDRIAVLETNLDDLVPEHFEYLMQRLLEAGAVDVSIQHLVMKKNRPGFLLRVLCPPRLRDEVAAVLMTESTAIGVRHQEWDRVVLERRSIRVETEHGRIRVKEIIGVDGASRYSAEYDDCAAAARRQQVPLSAVVRAAEHAASSQAKARVSKPKQKRRKT